MSFIRVIIGVSSQLGLGDNIARMSDLREEGDPKILMESDGFAEVYPEDKFLIVKGIQGGGHVVGMTGDGINDAPALRQAEVGIAVSNATDVAKKASSAVLTTEGLGGIVDLVKVGRMIFQRIATWIINKMIRTFKRVIFMVLAFIFTGQYVISAFDMILLLFLSDYVTLSLSTDRVRHSGKPESWDVTGLVKTGALLGIMMVVESFALLQIGSSYFGLYGNIDQLHTFVFDWLTFSGYFTVLAVRERRHFWDSRPSRPLILSIVANIGDAWPGSDRHCADPNGHRVCLRHVPPLERPHQSVLSWALWPGPVGSQSANGRPTRRHETT